MHAANVEESAGRPAPEPPASRWEAYVRAVDSPAIRAFRVGVWRGAATALVVGLAARIQESDPPRDPAEREYLIRRFALLQREFALRGEVGAVDALRDLQCILFAQRWPTLAERCLSPRKIETLHALHLTIASHWSTRQFERGLEPAGLTLQEQSTANGLPHLTGSRIHSEILNRMSRYPTFRVDAAEQQEIRAAPLYDGLRVRLVDQDGRHALSASADVDDPPRRYVHEWGAIYGVVDGAWTVVGLD